MLEFLYRDNKETVISKYPYQYKGSLAYTTLKGKTKEYILCDHCGIRLKPEGKIAHTKSLRCFSSRVSLQAQLEGYELGPVMYNTYTSPFAKTFPTKFIPGTHNPKKRGHIENQTWYPTWFISIWRKGSQEQSRTIPLILKSTNYCTTTITEQVPHPTLENHFKSLAKYKRKGKDIKPVVALIEMDLDSIKEKQILITSSFLPFSAKMGIITL